MKFHGWHAPLISSLEKPFRNSTALCLSGLVPLVCPDLRSGQRCPAYLLSRGIMIKILEFFSLPFQHRQVEQHGTISETRNSKLHHYYVRKLYLRDVNL